MGQPRQFREFREAKTRERWPVQFDIEGIERDTQKRKVLAQQLSSEEPMPVPRTENSFGDSKVVDINHPPRQAYRHQEYPKMLYHPTQKDQASIMAKNQVLAHNKLHPDKPLLVPELVGMNKTVSSVEEEKKWLAKGWTLKPPKPEWQERQEAEEAEDARGPEDEETDEFETKDETLCTRGCGKPKHAGRCARVEQPVGA